MNPYSENNKSINKIFYLISNCLLALSALAFMLFYFVQSIYIRPAYDDILFFSQLKSNHLFGSIQSIYLTWSGRWTGFVYFLSLLNISSSFQHIHFFATVYYCFTFCVLFYSVIVITRFCGSKFFNSKINTATIVVYSILFIASFYFFTFQNIEVWGWICGSMFYLQGIVFLLFGTALLLKNRNSKLHYLLISLSFIYVGGSNEVYSLTTISLFVIYFIYFLNNNQFKFQSFKNNKYGKVILIAFVSLIISSTISFSAPGNQVRNNGESTTVSSENTSSNVFTIGEFFKQKNIMLHWASPLYGFY